MRFERWVKLNTGLAGLALVCACSSESPVQSAKILPPALIAPSEASLNLAFAKARAVEVSVLSPKHFARALAQWERAKTSESMQLPTQTFLLRSAESELKLATETAQVARKVFAEPLEARATLQKRFDGDARKNTPARRAFERAEASFREIAELVEDDQIPRATREKKVVLRAYLECESFFSPIPSFEIARKNLEKAKLAGAERRFPEIFLDTTQTLEGARKFVSEHPRAYNETPRRIREADFYARRLLTLVRQSSAQLSTAE